MEHWDWVQQILAALHVGRDARGWLGNLVMTKGLERGVAAFGSAFIALALLAVSLCMALGLKTMRKLFDWHISEWDWSWLGLCAKGDMLYKSEDGLVRTQGSLITKGELESKVLVSG